MRRACADLAEKLLRDHSTPTVFIADDLDNFQELRKWISKAVDIVHESPSDMRIMRVFRSSRDERDLVNGEYELHLPLFTTTEGKTVLSANAGVGTEFDSNTVNRLIARTPFANSEGVSLCGMRLIKEWLRISSEKRPVDVLLGIIQRIIDPIATNMRQAIPYDDMKSALEHVRELLDQPDVQVTTLEDAIPNVGDIELIDLLGDLAWHSNYREQSPLTAELVRKWSSGSVEDEKLAESLLRKGEEAAIFSRHGNDTRWADQLVADGCAVMRLRSIDNDGLIAEMAARLVETNASEMLWMASDYDTFRRIINAVAARQQQLSVLDRILSGSSITWLARDLEILQAICQRLLELGETLQTPSQRAGLSICVWRLAQQDPSFLEALIDRAASDDTALCAVARQLPANEFQTRFAGLGNRALETAAWIWPSGEGLRLAKWCSKAGIDIALASDAFSGWCKRQTRRTLIDVLPQLVGQDWTPHALRWGTVFGAAAQVLADLRFPEADDRDAAIDIMKSALRTHPDDTADDVVLALFKLLELDKEFMSRDRRWVVVPDHFILVPTSPLGPSSLRKIRDHTGCAAAKGLQAIQARVLGVGCSGSRRLSKPNRSW